jgi:hypothetical protein
MKPLNLIVTGHKEHGKDEFCKILVEFLPEYSFASSSLFVAERVIFPVLAPLYGYKTIEECFIDRVNHRKEWFDLIVKYNGKELTRLGIEIFGKYHIYCGLRNIWELNALKAIDTVDLVIWIDASERKSLESSDSLTISKYDADIILDNNTSIEEFRRRILNFSKCLK